MLKIFILVFFSVFLVGCPKKEVTEAMLIGNWHCKTVELKGNDPHMNYNNYIDYRLTFFRDSKIGLTESYNSGTPIPITFKVYEREENKGVSGKIFIINENRYIYLSEDKFLLVSSNKIPREDGDLDFLSKTECARIIN